MDPLTLIGAIPTALNTVQSLGSLFQQPYSPPKQYQENSRQVFKKGGSIRGHNKYNAPTHEQGGQLVNDQGIPDPKGTNEIEGTESKYTYTRLNRDPYIFTPEDSQKVSKLAKKYKNANTSDLEKNALELSIQRIENKNEMKKKKQSSNIFRMGGKIKKYNDGGGLNAYEQLQRALSTNPNVRGYSTPSQAPVDQLIGAGVRVPKVERGPGSYGVTNPIQSNFKAEYNRPLPKVNINIPGGDTSTTPTGSQSTSNPLKTLDTLRNLTLAGSSLGMLKRAEREDPIMTDYSQARGELNKLDSNLDPMREQLAQSSNQMRNVNRNSASSYNSFSNREAQRVANLQQSLSNVTLQERQLANGIAGQRAQFESGVARDNSQTLRQNRINNQTNAATARTYKQGLGNNIDKELDRKSTILNNRNFADATIKEQNALASSLFSNFEANSNDRNILLKIARGESLTAEEENRKLELVKYKL